MRNSSVQTKHIKQCGSPTHTSFGRFHSPTPYLQKSNGRLCYDKLSTISSKLGSEDSQQNSLVNEIKNRELRERIQKLERENSQLKRLLLSGNRSQKVTKLTIAGRSPDSSNLRTNRIDSTTNHSVKTEKVDGKKLWDLTALLQSLTDQVVRQKRTCSKYTKSNRADCDLEDQSPISHMSLHQN